MENRSFPQSSHSQNRPHLNSETILTLNQPLMEKRIGQSINSSRSNKEALETKKEQSLSERAPSGETNTAKKHAQDHDFGEIERLRVTKEAMRIYKEKWKNELPGKDIEYLSEDGLQGIFKGEKREGKRYGKIMVLLEEDGARYEGGWQDDIMNGMGVFSLRDGSKYEGQFKNGLKHGFGTSTSSDGSIYDGQWKDNIQDGYGINTEADGSIYEGSWKEGMRHGKGTLKSSSGFTYTGNFLENKLSGAGVLVFADGTKYTGEFLKSKKHGSGVMIYNDGRKYEGPWIDDKTHGEGKLYLADGTIKRGVWKRGVFVKWLQEGETEKKL